MNYKNLLSLCLLTLISCRSNIHFYEGYVCNVKKQPMPGLLVYEKEDSLNVRGITNKKGFFRIKKIDNNSIAMYLTVEKDNEILDSVRIVGTSGGEKINYSFVNGKKDTLFINVR